MVPYGKPVLRADGGSVGARVVKTRDVEFAIGFAGALSAKSRDVSVRQGMPDLGYMVEFGPRVRFNLARPTSVPCYAWTCQRAACSS